MQISSLLVLAASVGGFDVERSLQISLYTDSVTAEICGPMRGHKQSGLQTQRVKPFAEVQEKIGVPFAEQPDQVTSVFI
jgi:hypothetical protein